MHADQPETQHGDCCPVDRGDERATINPVPHGVVRERSSFTDETLARS